ncbi:MAG: hypothetical protein IJV72_05625 [Clostridia bacterium]|nr:hypothetical protein [Clostridia bacterium]
MKKSVKVLALVMVALMLCMSLASCAKKLSGSYKGEINVVLASYEVVYEFKGDKVTVTRQIESLIGDSEPFVLEGTYEIIEDDDGELKIKFEYEKDDDVIKGGTFDFEEGDGYIKIAGVKYEKQD